MRLVSSLMIMLLLFGGAAFAVDGKTPEEIMAKGKVLSARYDADRAEANEQYAATKYTEEEALAVVIYLTQANGLLFAAGADAKLCEMKTSASCADSWRHISEAQTALENLEKILKANRVAEV
jgi:hypothetical protein